jgi:D-arabinose 5-phosphate isomerase GutQ
LGSVQTGDVAVLISKGGATHEIVAMLDAFRSKRVPIIAVTARPESPLGKAAELIVPVKIKREADEFDMLATTSTLAVIAWFDAVCIALMRVTGFTREQFALIHPGGAVGERLKSDSDVMNDT